MAYKTLKFSDGTYYGDVSFLSGKPNGYGKYTWTNGDYNKGRFKDGKPVGKGECKYTYNDTFLFFGSNKKYSYKTIYEGEVFDNLPNGKGKVTFMLPGGHFYYEGEFKTGIITGNGKSVFPCQSYQIIHIGLFNNGLFDGYGEHTIKTNAEIYDREKNIDESTKKKFKLLFDFNVSNLTFKGNWEKGHLKEGEINTEYYNYDIVLTLYKGELNYAQQQGEFLLNSFHSQKDYYATYTGNGTKYYYDWRDLQVVEEGYFINSDLRKGKRIVYMESEYDRESMNVNSGDLNDAIVAIYDGEFSRPYRFQYRRYYGNVITKGKITAMYTYFSDIDGYEQRIGYRYLNEEKNECEFIDIENRYFKLKKPELYEIKSYDENTNSHYLLGELDNGDYYEGYATLDAESQHFIQPSGYGKYKYNNGNTYEGYFEISEKHHWASVPYGLGKKTYADGRIEEGLFSGSKMVVPLKEIFLPNEIHNNETLNKELQEYFKDLIGMDDVKAQINTIYNTFKIDRIRGTDLNRKVGYNFILYGNPGTGKTTVARIIGKILRDLKILRSDNFVEVSKSDLVGEYIGQTEKIVPKVLEQARGGTLFIDEAYTLYSKDNKKDYGNIAIDLLLKDMEDHRGEYCVIMAGYKDKMEDMIRNANPGLASRFDYKINIPDYSEEELLNIIYSMSRKMDFYIKSDAVKVIKKEIDKAKVDDTFDNARFARRLLDKALGEQANRLVDKNKDETDPIEYQILKGSDFGEIDDISENENADYYIEKLNSLIGLNNVKQEVNNVYLSAKMMIEGRKRGLKIGSNNIPLNLVFTGNPGTGKTTVARMIGKIYYHLGLLKRDDVFVECTRADLIGQYQGHTAQKTKDIIRTALGGVLFIDEAYDLVNGDGDSFGKEAVNTLVSEIENNRDKIAVIMAGYTNEMNAFLDTNPGLRSRLAKTIEFPDYSLKELSEIFVYDMKNRGYEVECDEKLIIDLINIKAQAKDFGNARGVRNLCDSVIAQHNMRISSMNFENVDDKTMITIVDDDLDI